MSSESLYDKYGGFAGISSVVHDFYKRIQGSASLKKFFANTDMDKLIDHQIKFLCKVLGGPDNYDGRGLDRAHKMMKIDDSAFNEVGGHLKGALEAAGVEDKDVQTILGVVESVRGNIVTVKKTVAETPAPAPAQEAPAPAKEAAPAKAPASGESLYDKYGGFGGISGVVHDFYKRLLASKSLAPFFKNSDMDKLIDHQIKFLCKVLGGPDNYDGRALDRAHKMMKISDSAFDEVGGHLVDALAAAGVEKKDIDTIVGVVESVRGNIVTVKDESKPTAASESASPGPEAAASQPNTADRIPIVQMLDSAFALVHPKTLSLTYANPRFMNWTSIKELPCNLEDAFDPKVFADVKAQMLAGKDVITFECDSSPQEGPKVPVEYTLRLINWREGRYTLFGHDMSRVKEKDLMLKSFTQVIEVNNKKIKLEQRAVAELLDNMKQAVFTFNSDFKIANRYSKFVHTLFGEDVTVAGRNAVEFIFENGDLAQSDRDKFEMEMNFAYANGEFQWDLSAMAFPKQVKKTIADQVKDIKLVFVPIFHEDNLNKVMVVMEDMTEFNKAKRDAEEKSKDLERVAQLMAVNAEHFEAFESEIWGIFDRCNEALKALEGSLNKDDGEAVKSNVNELFRHIHTIKGNARSIQLKSVQEVAHQAEEHVGNWRDEGGANLDDLPELIKQVQFIRSEVKSYCDLRASVFGERSTKGNVGDSVEVVELLQRIGDAYKAGGNTLAETMRAVEEKRSELSVKLREATLSRYDALIQDIANVGGKKVNPIIFKGDVVAFAKAAKGQLNEILTHALRNAVDHGVETPDVRTSRGKQEVGNITIQFELVDNVHTLLIGDDGQGLQMQKIKAKAVERGLIGSEAAAKLTDMEAAELLFVSGFSTAANVSEISGRGVGMDAVRKAAQELGGDVTIGNAKSGGTEVLVMLPQREVGKLKKAS